MVHVRRKLFDVHEATKSPIAAEALRRIQALYQVEAEITGKTAAERHTERQARTRPLLADLKAWMEAQRRRASGKTVLGRALQYALGRWEALTRYADDGRLAIDNNVAERLMRGIAMPGSFCPCRTRGRRPLPVAPASRAPAAPPLRRAPCRW